MVAVVAPDRAEALSALLAEEGETVMRIGHVVAGAGVSYTGTLR
jgi:phosphoribosylformylglycinamidine cyclo-ligase